MFRRRELFFCDFQLLKALYVGQALSPANLLCFIEEGFPTGIPISPRKAFYLLLGV
jgi:hypothetical protein